MPRISQILNNFIFKHKNKMIRQGDQKLCPITHQIMQQPVIAQDGFTYDKKSIQQWFSRNRGVVRSPMTNLPMGRALRPNTQMKNKITQYKSSSNQQKILPYLQAGQVIVPSQSTGQSIVIKTSDGYTIKLKMMDAGYINGYVTVPTRLENVLYELASCDSETDLPFFMEMPVEITYMTANTIGWDHNHVADMHTFTDYPQVLEEARSVIQVLEEFEDSIQTFMQQ